MFIATFVIRTHVVCYPPCYCTMCSYILTLGTQHCSYLPTYVCYTFTITDVPSSGKIKLSN